jgi:hypothetical protein
MVKVTFKDLPSNVPSVSNVKQQRVRHARRINRLTLMYNVSLNKKLKLL